MTVKALIMLATLFVGGFGGEVVKVNTQESTVKWSCSKIVGDTHEGTISIKEGNLEVSDQGELTGGSFTIDMTSINCTDLSGTYKGKLEGHLRSDDFFGVKSYPEATFTITKVTKKSTGKYSVTGDITIKGKTQPISFDAEMTKKGANYVATSSFVVDRSKFDVRYGSDSFFDNLGDKVISNNIALEVRLVSGK